MERRGQYIEELNHQLPKCGQHPFVLLMKRCLNNGPTDRPVADELVSTLEAIKIDAEGCCGEIARADAVRKVVTVRALKKKERESEENEESLSRTTVQIQQLQQENERLQEELDHIQVCHIVHNAICSLSCRIVFQCTTIGGQGAYRTNNTRETIKN